MTKTTTSIFARWAGDLGMDVLECRKAWSIIMEAVFADLVQDGEASLMHLGTIKISENPRIGVRIRSAAFLKRARRQLFSGDPDGDAEWIKGEIRPVLQSANKGRKRRP